MADTEPNTFFLLFEDLKYFVDFIFGQSFFITVDLLIEPEFQGVLFRVSTISSESNRIQYRASLCFERSKNTT